MPDRHERKRPEPVVYDDRPRLSNYQDIKKRWGLPWSRRYFLEIIVAKKKLCREPMHIGGPTSPGLWVTEKIDADLEKLIADAERMAELREEDGDNG